MSLLFQLTHSYFQFYTEFEKHCMLQNITQSKFTHFDCSGKTHIRNLQDNRDLCKGKIITGENKFPEK